MKIAERKNHKDKKLSYDEVTGISKGVKHGKVEELMEEYGYQKEDLLSPEEISMYQFMPCENEKTRLEKLECTKYGFVVPTFNTALEKIVQEVYAFQED